MTFAFLLLHFLLNPSETKYCLLQLGNLYIQFEFRGIRFYMADIGV